MITKHAKKVENMFNISMYSIKYILLNLVSLFTKLYLRDSNILFQSPTIVHYFIINELCDTSN